MIRKMVIQMSSRNHFVIKPSVGNLMPMVLHTETVISAWAAHRNI